MIKQAPIVVLCGGEGTRLFPITHDEIPKSMIKILNRPFIEHQLELFAKKGITEAILLVGKMGGAIESYLENEYSGIELKYIYDNPAMKPGTGSAILNAYHDLPSQFILTYGDVYCDLAWPDSVIRNPFYFPILMTVYKNEGKHFSSNVEMNGDEIVVYNKHPGMPSHATKLNHIESGLMYINKSALCYKIEREFEETLKNLVNEKKVRAYITDKRQYDVGYPGGIHALEAHLNES
jgi:NDP-sugar pyrophosphorylase family protein